MVKNILEIVKAFVLINFLIHVSILILFDTKVAASQVLTIGITEPLNKTLKEFIYGRDRLSPLFIV
jgi:hypothetical protein